MPAPEPRRLMRLEDADIATLADVLVDCVQGGASVNFMEPLSRDRAVAFWRQVARDVSSGHRVLLVVEDEEGLCGTVQLIFAPQENQPHRAELSKLLVHRRARCRGFATALLGAADGAARESGKTLLVLDTVKDSDASRLYSRLGWQKVGDIPDYALMPKGGLVPTTVFYKVV